jgi:tetratricopeptide (TPR) repeat protein
MEGYRRHPHKSQRIWRSAGAVLLASVVAVFTSALDAYAAELCMPAMALVVSVQGAVELRRANEANWQPAKMNVSVCPGDTVRVRERGRAALRLSNESVVRLDQKTTLTLGRPSGPGKDQTALVELLTGALYVITRTPKPFKVRTPVLLADVEGTEFFISADQDSARLVIYEGKVSASNEHGSVTLASNESAIAARNEAPRKEAIVRPADAVQWALYYPTIVDYRLEEKVSAEPTEPAQTPLRQSIELYQEGRQDEALTALDNVPRNQRSPHLLTYRAGLLLSVGQVDEARADLEQALKLEPGNSNAYALQAIIAVVQNAKEQALNLATKAVELDQASSTARLALSYAQQAHFNIEDALASVQKAVELNSENALAWTRLAELHMSTGYLDRALKAAQRAADLNPLLSRTHTVLGFAHLTQINTEAAKVAFAQAIELDQADPMPRLGMGLAKIREGDLEEGRIELEIAASLDPTNSLIRSYLGKAYFEEKRYSLAQTQFDLAKALDPKDPTPFFYDAIQKQTQNRPVEALRDLQKSIDLNNNRAVYRSKLLLDQDRAARGSSLARIYDNLGFEKRALMETAKSLSLDPASHSSHRFLSDAYMNLPRHEIARVSELLQAQLLQPINVNPVQPRLAVADLNIITGTGPAVVGFNEFAPLLERNKPQLVASGIFGSRGTLGDETVLSALYGRASVSVGQFHYETKGFRTNNDQTHNVYNAFMQFAVTPRFNVQAEVRTRKTEQGNILLHFDPNDPLNSMVNRQNLTEDTARIGARISLSPQQDLITSAIYRDRSNGRVSPSSTRITNSTTEDTGYQAEAQYLFKDVHFNLIAGASTYQFQVNNQQQVDFTPGGHGPCPSGSPSVCNPPQRSFTRERYNGYIYANINAVKNLSLTLGLSYDSLKDKVDFEVNKLNPKFGLQWNITTDLRLRLAWFETVKPSLVANQGLEPTQVAGFNQLFDDLNETRAQRMGAGLDARVANNIYGGMEISARHLKVPLFNSESINLRGDDAAKRSRTEEQQEKLYRAYLYWFPRSDWAIKGEFQFEKLSRPDDPRNDPEPFRIQNLSFPLSLNYFNPNGIIAKVVGTYVRQNLERPPETGLRTGNSDFYLLDAIIGYRLPNRRGILSLEGKNLLNENFAFRSYNFQFNEVANPLFTPGRTFFARLTLNF